MREEKRAGARQVWVAAVTAALAPAATLPSLVARSGPAGWLGVAAVAAVAPLYLRLLRGLGDDGLAAALKTRWGGLGRCGAVLYYLWALSLAALTAGGCVDRLARTDYGELPPWLVAVAVALAAGYLTRRGWGCCLRAVQVFFLTLAALLGLFLVLGATNLDGAALDPGGWGGAARGLGGLWPAGATVSVAALALFIPRAPRREGERSGGWWVAVWALAAAGLCAVVTGTLGAQLTAKAPLPFFLALQGIGFPGGFQRLEAAGTAAWTLADLTLISLAALAGRELAGGETAWRWPILAAAVLGGWFLPNAAVAGAQTVLLWVNAGLGLALPVLVALTGPRREVKNSEKAEKPPERKAAGE